MPRHIKTAALAGQQEETDARTRAAVESIIADVRARGDRAVREALAALFDGGVDPMVVIRWKDLFERLEEAIDACEHVAHVLEGIVLKET